MREEYLQRGPGQEEAVRAENTQRGKRKETKKRAQRIIEHPLYQTGFFVLFSFAQFIVLELFFNVAFLEYSIELMVKNVAIILAVNLLLAGICHGVRGALCISSVFFLCVGIANYFVILFRGYGIVFMDLYALRTAATVAGNYHYDMSILFVEAVVGSVGLIAAARIFLPGRKHAYTHAKYILISFGESLAAYYFFYG